MAQVYIIAGDPTPLARPRLGKRKVYDPQKNLKTVASIHVANQHDGRPFLEGPLHLDVTFFMKAPESISLKRREALYGCEHIFKPDTDNLVKFISDICIGIIFYDDCSISRITARKVYDSVPRTEFVITRLLDYQNDK